MQNPRLIDLTGQRFGRLSVITKFGNTRRGGALWKCVCDCGTHRVCHSQDLRAGKSTSCGCYAIEDARRRFTKHGGKGTRLYRIWKAMNSRCNNPRATGYAIYGGAGIKVCEEWRDFENFRAWAMQAGYSDKLTIERTNNALGYGPSNCTWASKAKQAVNRRIVLLSPNGEPWCEIAKRNGISVTLMHGRIHEGWPIEKAATLAKGSRVKLSA